MPKADDSNINYFHSSLMSSLFLTIQFYDCNPLNRLYIFVLFVKFSMKNLVIVYFSTGTELTKHRTANFMSMPSKNR